MQRKTPTPFTAINAISSQRPLCYMDLMEMNAPYEPFLMNRAMSLSSDTVLAANQMNHRSFLDKDQQATYLIYTIRPRKRFEKWPKLLKDEQIDIIANYYGMSKREAKFHRTLHTETQYIEMRKLMEEGIRPPRLR